MNANPLVRCVYASRATARFSESDLPALLAQAREANAGRDVTGMLLFIEGNFFQVLEGRSETVEALFEHICRDDRHTRVTRIIFEPIAERDFAEWTMGFARLETAEVAGLAGINDFFSAATCIDQLGPGRAKKLLQAFGKGRWRAGDTGLHRAHARMG